MKIGIDTFGCDHGKSGLGSYLYSFIQNLPESQNFEFELFGSEIDKFTYLGDNSSLKYKSVGIPDALNAERFWHTFCAKSFIKKNNYDAVIYPAAARMLPKKFNIPGICIVNDVVSSILKRKDDLWTNLFLKKSLSNVDCIIASSDFIKRDLLNCGIKTKRIEVIYNGLDHSLFYNTKEFDSEAEYVNIKPFAIKRPYIIYASRMQNEDKKHIELIKAFEIFKEKTKFPHRLVIAGSEGPFSDIIHRAAYSSNWASDIFITGYFPHENFPQLYANASACVFPSVNEGVGLPVLEAMATGLPVACSDEGALKEVTGGNALFFDSNNVEDIASCIEKIISDEVLREKLKNNGIDWTKRYTWEKTVSSVLKITEDFVKC